MGSKNQQSPVNGEQAEIKSLIDNLEPFTSQMNRWEKDFYESVVDAFERQGTLTSTQKLKLEEIYARLER